MEKKNYTYDYIAGSDIYLWQRKDMFRINTDTAQLAHFMKIKKGERVLDIGTNNGALLLFAKQYDPAYLCGIEIQEEACELARYNLFDHGITNGEILCGDFTEMTVKDFDVVVCNPPFFQMGDHGNVEMNARSIARHELFLPLEKLLRGVQKALKENGRFYMVHRSERIVDIVEECRKNRLEIKTMQFVFDDRKELAVSVLIEAVLGASPLCQVPHPTLLNADGTFVSYRSLDEIKHSS